MWVEGLGVKEALGKTVRFRCGFEQGEKKETIVYHWDESRNPEFRIQYPDEKGVWPRIRTYKTRIQTEMNDCNPVGIAGKEGGEWNRMGPTPCPSHALVAHRRGDDYWAFFPKVAPWTGQPWALGSHLFEIEGGKGGA